VIITDQFLSILQILRRFFGRRIIAYPSDSILQAGATTAPTFPSGIQDFLYIELLNAFNFDRRGRRVALTGDRVIIGGIQQVNMKDRVIPHRGRELQFVSVRAYALQNSKGT
jgi:hypothetical protein